MPLVSNPAHLTTNAKPRQTGPLRRTDRLTAIAEINAYIAIRDELFVEAKRLRTRAKLDSVTIANDFVQSSLKPARVPYEAQCLPEPDAARERKRCEAVRNQVAELRAAACL
jgi:hypothetical protein